MRLPKFDYFAPTTLEEAHRLCDHLEEDIKQKLSDGLVTIHCESCGQTDDDACPPDCPVIQCSLNMRWQGTKEKP